MGLQVLAGCVVMWKLHECGKSWLVVLSCGSYMCVASLGWLCCHVEAKCVWQVLAGCVVTWELHVCGKSWLVVLSCGSYMCVASLGCLSVLSCGSYMGMARFGCLCCHVGATGIRFMGLASLGWLCCDVGTTRVWQVLAVCCVVMWERRAGS